MVNLNKLSGNLVIGSEVIPGTIFFQETINKILKISNAVTSRGNFSVTKREKAKTISDNTINISKFIIMTKLA